MFIEAVIRFIDMFSGIGGFREGLTRAGEFECVGHCEIDKYANRSYNALFDTKGEWFIDTTDENGNPTTTEITETVLVIELTHKTPDEMAADYHFTTRQNTYLQLLQDPQYEELWAELLGGFAQGGGELMNPDSTRIPTGTLQWPLPVAGTIASQFGHRVDPITGEVSSHTGTDMPVPRERRFSPPQTELSSLPTALTVVAAATATTSKSTTAAGWKHCTPTVRPSASPPASRCRRGRSSAMLATPAGLQAAICIWK